jgi:putrescine transport system permease protein
VASLVLLSVSLATFAAWYLGRRAEKQRKKAVQQAMQAMAEESSSSTWTGSSAH